MNRIALKTRDVTIYARLDNSETTRAFLSLLPRTFEMGAYDGREYYTELPEKLPLTGENIPDYQNGDVTYFPELNTLAIFYAKAGLSSQPGLIKLGTVESDLAVFHQLGETFTCSIEITP